MQLPETNCARARESVSAQLDGELLDLDLDRLEAHLLICPECSVWAERVRDVTAQLRATGLEEPAERLVLSRRARSWRVGSAVAVASAAAVVATIFVTPGQHAFGARHRSSVSRFAGPEVQVVVERPLLLDGRYPAVSVARAPHGFLRAV